jgi:hypothetical protein
MPKQQGQGHYPSTPPGNKSAGPDNSNQTSSQTLAGQSREGGIAASRSQDPQQKARIMPNG